ncbi:MAG: glycosyltransferase family 2 protein [Clostridia bacterium]|nr:glycosyltransferase family 2 protein [Clostridia bacterium]
MKDGLISIIIPVYNRELYLDECLNSVFNQTYQNFEIILIDDGSTDNSLQLCRGYAEKDSRIKLLCVEHGGVSNARNKGIEAAEGEFIFFLDSDDAIHPILLEALVEAFQSTDAGLGGTNYIAIGRDQWYRVAEVSKKTLPKDYTYHNFEESVNMLVHGGTPLDGIGGVMMRKEIIGDTKFNPEFFIGEDYLFSYENLIKGHNTVFLDKRLYYARKHGTNSSENKGFEGFLNRYDLCKFVWRTEEANGRNANAKKRKRFVFTIFRNYIRVNKIYGKNSSEIRKFMRTQKKELFSGFRFREKLEFYVGCYCPLTYILFIKLNLFAKKIYRKIRK